MEKIPINYSETQDFMNVESFSQLPFIRPALPQKEKGFRLFGKEFGGVDSNCSTDTDIVAVRADECFSNVAVHDEAKEIIADNNNGGENTRKYECQFCNRHFPTSQALGGHQNAHKRERQHARRANLQSAMMHAGNLAEAAAALPPHAYGLMNYYHHRLGATTTTPAPLGYHHDSRSPSSGRFYGGGGGVGYGSYSQYSQNLINGSSPLAAWRIPAAHSSPTYKGDGGSIQPRPPLLGNLEFKNPQNLSFSTAAQTRLGYDQSKTRMQDQVSLDLHL